MGRWRCPDNLLVYSQFCLGAASTAAMLKRKKFDRENSRLSAWERETSVVGLCQSKVSSGQVSLGRCQKAPSLCGEEGEMTPPGSQVRCSEAGCDVFQQQHTIKKKLYKSVKYTQYNIYCQSFLSIKFSNITYIHPIVQPVSRNFSSCKTETL